MLIYSVKTKLIYLLFNLSYELYSTLGTPKSLIVFLKMIEHEDIVDK